MNLTRGLLAAVGAFWSEVIPPYVPADYEDGTERFDPDWETPGSPLCHFCDLPSGHDGPHKDCMCGRCPSRTDQAAPEPSLRGEGPSVACDIRPSPAEGHPAVPTGVESPQAPPVGLPMFKASELVTVAAEYIAYHDGVVCAGGLQCRCGVQFPPPLVSAREKWSEHVASPVVSALVHELQALTHEQNQSRR